MMFNEYLNHSNQCSNYYNVVRKEDIQMQQADTNRFKQKWVDVNQTTYPQQYQMKQQQQQPQQQQQQQYTANTYQDYNRQSNTPSNQNYDFIPKQNERSITPTVQQQKQYYYQNNNMQQQQQQQNMQQQNRNYYTNTYDFNYDQNQMVMSPANKFNKKISSSSLTNASHIDFNQAPTPSSSSTSSVLSPQPQSKIDSPKSWNTPVPTPLSVSQTTPPRTVPSSQSASNLANLDLSQELDKTDSKDQSSTNKSILSEININIDELFLYYPSVFEEIYYSLKLNSIEQIENDLRRYLEEHFKLNLSNNSNNSSSTTQPVNTSSTGIRI